MTHCRRHIASVGLLVAMMVGLNASAETTATLTLDGLSYISFQDEEIMPLASGSRLTFRFSDPSPGGSVHFTIAPSDVEIPPITIGPDKALQYGLANVASGTMITTSDGRKISFTATIAASLGEGEALLYTMPFTTETTSATNQVGTVTVEVTGLRLVEGVWYVQLVGATVNKENAYPKPGAAVYSVLSGSFDQLPEM